MGHPSPDSGKHTDLPPPRKIQVLCIPVDRSRPFIYLADSVSYINIEEHPYSADTEAIEKELKHVPDLRHFARDFNLEYRCLFDRDPNYEDMTNEWDGKYFIYKCTDPVTAGQLQNRNLMSRANAYGYAFVFKLNELFVEDEKGETVFGNMEDFALSVNARGIAYYMLREMLSW